MRVWIVESIHEKWERENEQAQIGHSCEMGAITHNEIWFAIHPNRYCLLFILWESDERVYDR